MIKTVRDIWVKRAILWHFVSVQLTSNYRTKSLGFVWALLDPLLFMAVYYLVFGVIIAHRKPDFMVHLFIGVIAFRFLNGSMALAAGVLRAQSGLIREIAFPRAALPVAVVGARLFDFVGGWLVAIPLAMVFGVAITPYWLLIPLLIVVQLLFVIGISLVVAYIGVYFADTANILNVVQRLWFYMSPVLYDLTLIKHRAVASGHPALYDVYRANPMVGVLGTFEAVAMKGELPGWHSIAYAVGWGLAMFVVGLWVFSRAEGHIAKYV